MQSSKGRMWNENEKMVGLSLARRTDLSVSWPVQYSVCMVGDAFFHNTAFDCSLWRWESVLQPLLRTRTAAGSAGQKAEAVPQCAASKISAQPLVPVWLLGLFHGNVWFDAVRYLSGFAGAPLKKSITLLWVFKLPWQWPDVGMADPWAAQFAFGFFSVMLTSTILGIVTMVLFRPRSWCVYCPMGTMTQGICKLRGRREGKNRGRTGKNCSSASKTSGQ